MMQPPPMGERPGGSSWASAAITPWQTDAFNSVIATTAQHLRQRLRYSRRAEPASVTSSPAPKLLPAMRQDALRLAMPGRAGKAQARLVGPRPCLPKEAGAVICSAALGGRCRARDTKPASSSRFNEE